jgi:hypothetical protein
MADPAKANWHDLVVYDPNGANRGSVKELLAVLAERKRQWLFDCLLELRNGDAGTDSGPSFAIAGAAEGSHHGRHQAMRDALRRNAVDWDGFDWRLSTRAMEDLAGALMRQGGGDPRAARAIFQLLLTVAEAYQDARSGVYAELRQVAARIYVPRLDLGDQIREWNGARVAVDLSTRGLARFPQGIEGLLRFYGDRPEPIFVHGEQLLDVEVIGLARLPGSDPDDDGVLLW